MSLNRIYDGCVADELEAAGALLEAQWEADKDADPYGATEGNDYGQGLSDGYRLAMSFLRELAKAKREGK